jgi:hypothetical protein
MQNFGKIKNTFNNLLVEAIAKKDENAKKLFKKYIKTIKESEILRTQFLIYSNIENKIGDDSLSVFSFVSENLRLLEKYNQKDILKENSKLASMLNDFKHDVNEKYDLLNLHESITKLTFINKTPQNIEKVMTEVKNITDYILANKPKEVNESFDLPLSMLSKLMVEKYNDKYSSLSEADKEVIKVLINPDVDAKKELYQKEVNECVKIIDKLLSEESGEAKEKLLKVKAKLLEEQEIDSDKFLDKISKLMELKNNLIDN